MSDLRARDAFEPRNEEDHIIVLLSRLSGRRTMLESETTQVIFEDSTMLCKHVNPRIYYDREASQVFAYPSEGGYVILMRPSSVELAYLALRPSESTHRYDEKEKEDAFALHLMQLGGRWWPSQEFHRRHAAASADLPGGYGPHYPMDLHVGYPADGSVLVLSTLPGFDRPGRRSQGQLAKPSDWSRLQLCSTMEERCTILREFGASSYPSIERCPHIPATLEEGLNRDREYEKLMLKMEDEDYVENWVPEPIDPDM